MIEGIVNANREAVISLPLLGPAGATREINAVIDTGHSGSLTLPPTLVEELELPFKHRGRALLANGAVETFDVHDVTVVRDGRPRDIEVDAVGPSPLAGMLLLDSHNLFVEVTDGGRVVIQAREKRQRSRINASTSRLLP